MTEDQSEDEEEGEDGLDELGEVLKQYGGLLNEIADETAKKQLDAKKQLNAIFGIDISDAVKDTSKKDEGIYLTKKNGVYLVHLSMPPQHSPLPPSNPLSDKEKLNSKILQLSRTVDGLKEWCEFCEKEFPEYIQSAEGKEEIVKNFEQNRKEWIETAYNGERCYFEANLERAPLFLKNQ